ncbi:MAG: hypothetical protein JSV04_04320, partial [Candidatus Heimdallarchaeota archaeon]
WKNIPNLNTSSEIWINSSNIQTSLPCIFLDVINGNYTFLIRANQTGTFYVVLRFFSTVFEDKTLPLTIEILPIPTDFAETSPDNGSSIGEFVPYFYFSKSYDIAVVWRENFNNTTIIDSNPTISGNGRDYISLETPFTNQTHIFKIRANALGTYQATITFSIDNYEAINYIISFMITIMPTKPLTLANVTVNHPNNTLLVEDVLSLNGSGFQTIENDLVPVIEEITLKMNNTLVPPNKLSIIKDHQFTINLSTEGYHWGSYILTIELNTTGYVPQALNLTINLTGRQIKLTVDIPQGKTIERGENITINVLLEYSDVQGGGSGSTVNLVPLKDVNVTFYVVLRFENGSDSDPFEKSMLTDSEGRASYTIAGQYTKSAVGFANISVFASSSSSGLPSAYIMSQDLLDDYLIQKSFIERMLELIIPIVTVVVIVIVISGSVYVLNSKRIQRSQRIRRGDLKIEQSFEDIKSIRLLIARHESGLQFYSEKTIAELQTDTDALSGMSAALSSFMEEVSDAMRSRPEGQREDKIEVMSREGLHMLIWHGKYSSFIIISEVRLPDYFKDRLKQLGHEVEDKYAPDLQDFYSADQIPSSTVKKMVRRYIPLHYFSAFILNEGVLTLESIKLSGKEKKMFNLIKEIRFEKDGVPFLFSEQIISHLSARFKRSEAIKFLNYAIEINLLVEASQEDILKIGT